MTADTPEDAFSVTPGWIRGNLALCEKIEAPLRDKRRLSAIYSILFALPV